jgi:hypothetical protein
MTNNYLSSFPVMMPRQQAEPMDVGEIDYMVFKKDALSDAGKSANE